MDDIVAVEVHLAGGERRYFLTWGRIQDTGDPAPLAQLVLDRCSRFDLGGEAVAARVRWTLHDAAAEPYFFECFFEMCQRRIPFGDGYDNWRQEMDTRMRDGKELFYLGRVRADGPEEPTAPHAVRG